MSLIATLARLTLSGSTQNVVARGIATSSILRLHTTPILLAEPLKKKKKLDPQVIKNREERKRKKIEKQIRRLEKNARQLKPIDDLEVPLELINEKKVRTRKLEALKPEEVEKRALLQKEWARFKLDEKIANFATIDRLQQSQQKALEELRKESEELYHEAIQPDLHLVPISLKGPVATPPIQKYESPDGEYIDISKKWE